MRAVKISGLSTLIGAALGFANFMVFVHFYNRLTATHISEYWKMVNADTIFLIVLPIYLAIAFTAALVLILIFTRKTRQPPSGAE